MNHMYSCYATAAFGLEGLVAAELRSLNMTDVKAENGGVRFIASAEEILICNLKLHFCERVFLIVAENKCTSFEELFQLVYSVPWDMYADGNESFLVSAKCARSKLMSPRDCQSITKKALLEKLKKSLKRDTFPENGTALPILVSVHSDLVRIGINTSGNALSRRGYRTWNGEAPLRETLAAALVQLSPWKPGMPLYDPCCGTGTILVEAAMIASNKAPGIVRSFAMENFLCFRELHTVNIRKKIASEYHPDLLISVSGSDIDAEAVRLAERHIVQAEMKKIISVRVAPLQNINLHETNGVFVCNPPYGERISDIKSCHLLYQDLRALKDRHPSWSICIISSDPAFERYFGKRADKKRRLYNGRLECTYYIYY